MLIRFTKRFFVMGLVMYSLAALLATSLVGEKAVVRIPVSHERQQGESIVLADYAEIEGLAWYHTTKDTLAKLPDALRSWLREQIVSLTHQNHVAHLKGEEAIHLTIEHFRRHLDEDVVQAYTTEITSEFDRVRNRIDGFLDWAFSYSTKGWTAVNAMRDAGNWIAECANHVKADLVTVTPNHNAAMFRNEFSSRVFDQSWLDKSMSTICRKYESTLQNKLVMCMQKMRRDLSEILNENMTLPLDSAELDNRTQAALYEMSHEYSLSAGARLVIGTVVSEVLINYTVGSVLATQWYAAASTQAVTWIGLPGSALVAVSTGLVRGIVGVIGFVVVDYFIDSWQRPRLREQLISMISKLENGLIYGAGTSDGFRISARNLNAEVCRTLESLFQQKILEKAIENRVAACKLLQSLIGS
ncbi:MAG TPA: hypothetical protein PKO06_06605 [Candidatus Ozemobacteraceae bacterium]|nr:hypothetical protein [Candidatus Ozemobacteraceae bacterium]